jgi:hypothetical protein
MTGAFSLAHRSFLHLATGMFGYCWLDAGLEKPVPVLNGSAPSRKPGAVSG